MFREAGRLWGQGGRPMAAYTAEEVDDLIAKFEKCAERQIANKGSAVKLRAAERDLLQVAEVSRDLMVKAVKGDKALLQQVFGGNGCERFHRYRNVINEIEFSDMHASDQRWGHLKDIIESIEEILKQLGMFKPWQIGKKAPESLTYSGLRGCFQPGEKVRLQPQIVGGEPSTFTVEPPLPQGLIIVPNTGEIKGVLRPDAEVEETPYQITCKNDVGEATFEMKFAVKVPAPDSVAIAGVLDNIFTHEEVTWDAKADGGPVKEWSITPDLPTGMRLDPRRGAITGAPTQPTERQEYTVTATNSTGQASAVIAFAVKIAPPVSLVYPNAQEGYPVGGVVYLRPEVTLQQVGDRRKTELSWKKLRQHVMQRMNKPPANMPKMTFAVNPPLPEGLVLVPKTGVITGRPSKPTSPTTYEVSASNEGGTIKTEITFAILLIPPSALKYSEAAAQYFVGDSIMLTPEVEGLVAEWSISPELPQGLDFDLSSGVIAGTPKVQEEKTVYTVKAKNAEGEAAVSLEFSVLHAPPTDLRYVAATPIYPTHRDLKLAPTVSGQVDAFLVDPSLPEGLSLDPKSGVISGMPTAVAPSTTYKVTAKNDTGETSTELTFEVQVMPPEELSYPSIDDVYNVEEVVSLEPHVVGGPTAWAIEPALPEGLELDPSTGLIRGAPKVTAEEASYVVTASNEAGGTSAVITFAVTAPPPSGLTYPTAGDDYVVEGEVTLEPVLEVGVCATFSVEPKLPDGLALDTTTGVITGSPVSPTDFTKYTVTAKNIAGATTVELGFCCSEVIEIEPVDENFATMIESITDLAEMVEEPSKLATMADWMVWMVHRAYLNDPTLTDFNFNNLQMPLPHLEPRVAPKLMKAMEKNTHIVSLQLVNSNLQKPQGHELALSLRRNSTLQNLNIECNNIDSDAIRACAQALKENEDTALEVWRFSCQKHVGDYFGRPVEEALAELMEVNRSIVKLGFSCNDPHWRMVIDRNIMRNVDTARRRRKRTSIAMPEEVAADERPMSRISFVLPPEKAVWEIFEDDDENLRLIRSFVAEKLHLPSKEQLQSYAKSAGRTLKYSEVAPLVRSFRSKLFDSGVGAEVLVYDAALTEYRGVMRGWTEKNESWSVDLWPDEPGKRYNFTLNHQPNVDMSAEFADWLRPT